MHTVIGVLPFLLLFVQLFLYFVDSWHSLDQVVKLACNTPMPLGAHHVQNVLNYEQSVY